MRRTARRSLRAPRDSVRLLAEYCRPTHTCRIGIASMRLRSIMLPSRVNTIVVTIANDVADIAVVADALEKFGVEHGVPHQALVALQVAVDEIVSNVIKYAWKSGAHQLHVRITAQAHAVEIEIVDDGEAFNPLHAPVPRHPQKGLPAPGGVGIHMVRQLVDMIEYARKGMSNHTIMTKRCTIGVPPESGAA